MLNPDPLELDLRKKRELAGYAGLICKLPCKNHSPVKWPMLICGGQLMRSAIRGPTGFCKVE